MNIAEQKIIKVKYLSRINRADNLTVEEQKALQPVSEKYLFRTNDYYDALIDWNDDNDPLRRLVYPNVAELESWGDLVTSSETDYVVAPGLEHKHIDTGLLLVNDVCAAYCRYCFRKRLFTHDNDEVVRDITLGLTYIKAHKEINNVILSGGDPLVMSTSQLERIIDPLLDIEHLETIRIGTKIPAFNPFRILNDPSLLVLFKKCIERGKRLYIMSHFTHSRELTPEAIAAVEMVYGTGARMWNQTPMLQGINDSVEQLAALFHGLAAAGIPSYYVYICRPTAGNKPYVVPVEKALQIFTEAKFKGSGLVKSARLIMTPKQGKLEVLGLANKKILFKYHHSANPANEGKIFAFNSNPDALWFSDYRETSDGEFD